MLTNIRYQIVVRYVVKFMKMIKEINIRNFQSHKETLLELHPGVNVIVGASDSGKTAIIRALRWLIWNRPTGDSFCSNWGGITHVSILTEEHRIARNKMKSDNSYVLGLSDSEELMEFKAFSTEVPEEIADALNISEINVQQQLDSPYLLSESPGKVAAHFNWIARLDKIDAGVQSIQKSINGLNQTIKFKEDQLKAEQTELDGLINLEKFEAELEVLEQMEKDRYQLIQTRRKLQGTVDKLVVVEDEISEHSWILELEPEVIRLMGMKAEKDKLESQRNDLNRLLYRISNNTTEVKKKSGLIELDSTVQGIFTMLGDLTRMRLNKADLGGKLDSITRLDADCKKLDVELSRLNKIFFDNFPAICPLCGHNVLKHK